MIPNHGGVVDVRFVKLNAKAKVPEYMSRGASGCDVCACLEGPVILKPLSRAMISTGLAVELSPNLEIQVRPRSGLAIRHGISILNAPGTIDSDYRGEICVLLVNLGAEDFVILDGMRIAQMVICRVERAEWLEVPNLNTTERGVGGFGSTGISSLTL